MPQKTPYINIHTHLPPEEEVISLYNAGIDPDAFQKYNLLSIGIHPWYISKIDIDFALNFIRKNAESTKVLAIGECGLDKLTDVPLSDQEKIFIEQIKIAEEVKKPLIIHCVKAFDELIRIKKEQKITVPMIIHGFNNKKQIALQLIKEGFYISLGKALMIENSNAQEIIKLIDPQKFFLETDDGNYSIKSIFDKASELLKIDIQEMKKQMMQNFKKLTNNG